MKKLTLLSAMTLSALAQLAYAQQTSVESYELAEIPVVAGGFTEEEKDSPVNNIVFDQKTLELSPAETLSDFLQDQGFAVIPAATPYESTEITIRGFDNGHHWNESSSRIIFLLNGRRSGVNNIRQLALNNVERIEVIRGPEMLKYSAGSPGGIINIVTKKGAPELFSGTASVGGGSWGKFKSQVTLNGTAPTKDIGAFDYSLGYSYGRMGNYKDGNGDTVENSKTSGINTFNGAIGYTFLKNHRIGFEQYYYDVNRAHKPQYWDEEEGELKDPSIAERRSRITAFTYDGHTDDQKWSWNASYSFSRDQYVSISDPGADKNFMGNKIDTNQARVSLNYTGDLVDWGTGADYIRYKTFNSGSAKKGYDWFDPNISKKGYPLHLGHHTENTGLYWLGTLKLLENTLNITGGLRYDYAKITDKFIGDEPWWNSNSRQWKYYGDKTGENMPTKRTFAHWSPSIGVSYLPVEWLKLRTNYFRGFRAPGGRQLFSSDSTEGYGAPGNPLLEPELSDNFEIGFDARNDIGYLSFTYFISKFKNHITIRALKGGKYGSGPMAQNADERLQGGIEVQGALNVPALLGYKEFDLIPYVNFTYMTKYDELVNRGFEGTPTNFSGNWAVINGVPKKTASYGIRFAKQSWGTQANLNFTYFGETWGGGSPAGYTPNTWKTYGKFTLANFSLKQRLYSSKKYGDLNLKFQANNLFNKTYNYSVSNGDVYYPGRNFYAEIQYAW